MKKLIAILVACALMFGCVACSKEKKLEDVVDADEIVENFDISSLGGIFSDVDIDIDGNTLEYIYTVAAEYDSAFVNVDSSSLNSGALQSIAQGCFDAAEKEGIKGEVTVIFTYLFSNGNEIARFEYSNK